MASSLESLPTEILYQIISYLCPHYQGRYRILVLSTISLKPISPVSKACRRLREVAQPILFHYFYHYGAQEQGRLVSFLHALTSRPDLTRAVSILQFMHYDDENLTESDRTLIETCVAGVGLPPLPPESCCPNLEALSFSTDLECPIDLFPSFPIALPTPISFPRLHRLSIGCISHRDVAALLEAAPNLRELYIPRLEGFESNRAHFPAWRYLRKLKLASDTYHPSFLKSIIAACPQLQSFGLELRAFDNDTSNESASTTDVWAALPRAKDTLQEIIVEIDPDIPLKLLGDRNISSLQHFRALKALGINGYIWHGLQQTWTQRNGYYDLDQFVAELFPPTLKKLLILNTGSPIPVGLLALARCVSQGLYPRLTMVEVEYSDHFSSGQESQRAWYNMRASLETEFDKAGVSFSLDIEEGFGYFLVD
ncbi:hypothetical protein BDW59DRAFT_158245 [Aspergillus cavernicola]|uniref:F-box domain-containing protein n=1 Tax=Aspergillus cavernicola TaxID=176166 RepID=A0ABR4ISR0_9EURO